MSPTCNCAERDQSRWRDLLARNLYAIYTCRTRARGVSRMAKVLGRYLSFYGRLARQPFFVRNVYLAIVATLLLLVSMLLFVNGGLWWWFGVVVVAAWIALICVGSASLMVRRLHDLGLSGYHVVWVGAAEIGATALSYGPPKIVLLALPLAAVGLWLLFWPGNVEANRFGAVPE
jgi:uncharacterized membrane protein YhaH (DUF805 family)